MNLPKAEDGSPLEVKEGVVLDRDGHEIDNSRAHSHARSQRIYVWRPNPLLASLLAIPTLILFASIGFTLFAILAALAVAGFIVLTFLRLLRRL